MKSNYKFLSSLALTGMLATSIMGTTVHAATPAVEVVGVCSNVLSTKMVPFVVTNGATSVTVADIQKKFDVVSVNGTAVSNNSAVVKTGDTFKVKSGAEYTIVVYGDANKDGSVDTFDALYIQENAFNEFKGETKVAADVIRKDNSGVDTFDALRIQEYAGDAQTRITNEPHTPDAETPVVTDSNYTVKVNDGYINNQNEGKTAIEIKLAKTYDEPKNLKIKLIDKNKKVISADSASDSDSDLNVTIPANTDKYVLSDKTGETPAGSDTSINVSNLANGEITIELHEIIKGKDTVVGTFYATKNVADVKAAKISASRPSATTAALSLEGYGENKIVTVKYTIAGTTEEKEINNVNDKLVNQKLDYVFPEGATTMDITLVDEYGNEVDIANVAIPAHGAKAVAPVEKVTAPDLTKTATATFAITTANGANVTSGEAILYTENGKIVESKPITNSDANKITFTTLNKAGKYKVGVIVNGDGSSTINSEEKYSELVEVKELNAVGNVEFNVEKTGAKVISWTDSNDVNNIDTTRANDTEYTLTFEELDGDNGYKNANPVPDYTLDAEKHTATITGNLEQSKVYKVTVVVNPKANQGEWIASSNPTVSNPFFYINASNLLGALESRTDSSLTYELANPIEVNGTEATYKAEVYKVNTDLSGVEYMSDTMESKNAVVTTKDGKKYLTIEGLEDNQKYVIRIIAKVGDVQGESNLVGYNAGAYTNAPKTYATTPVIDGLKIVKSSDISKAVAGKLFVNGNDVIVNGDTNNVITIDNNNYTPEFNAILKLAKNLLDNDEITVNNNESVSLKLTKDESSNNVMTLNNDYEGLEINVQGSAVESDRKMTIANGAKLAKVTVGGNGLILNLTNSDAETPVYLNNGAEVTGGNTYTLVSGATATINGITATTTSAPMSITATVNKKELQVNAPKGDINTDLTFTNNNNGRYSVGQEATINFASNDQTSRIAGTVTINSENGSVKVTSPNDNSLDITKLNLTIDVTNANVDITGFEDSAKVNVNVATTEDNKTDTTVKAKMNEVPAVQDANGNNYLIARRTIAIKDYTDEDTIVLYDTISGEITLDKANFDLDELVEFINSFGIKEEAGATISIDTASKSVTITFPKETDMSKVNLSGFATYEAE